MSRKKLIIISVLTAAVLAVLAIIGYLTQPKVPSISDFSNSFIRDFSTYTMSDTEDYNKRIANYINQAFLTDFSDKYFLQKQSFVSEEEKNNYSTYVSSSVSIISQTSSQAVVNVTYTVKKVDAPGRSKEFQETKDATIIIKKEGNKLSIINFYFAT